LLVLHHIGSISMTSLENWKESKARKMMMGVKSAFDVNAGFKDKIKKTGSVSGGSSEHGSVDSFDTPTRSKTTISKSSPEESTANLEAVHDEVEAFMRKYKEEAETGSGTKSVTNKMAALRGLNADDLLKASAHLDEAFAAMEQDDFNNHSVHSAHSSSGSSTP
jgi:hypothetical protein